MTNVLDPRSSVNKAYLKIKPNRVFIEKFKSNLIYLLDHISGESEEFHKNLVADFLKKTYYEPSYFINTKGKNDLVIHNSKEPSSSVGVIIEAKSPSNKSEMISKDNLNRKALQELVYYYMQERITNKNTDIKHLIVTNINDWFIFDAHQFNKYFGEKVEFIKKFKDFEEKRSSGGNTNYFYKDIAEPRIAELEGTLEFTYFNIPNYEKVLRDEDKSNDRQLIALSKLLSPEHLLKLSFANDSNSLDKNFYNELLHIIGLTETKEGGKKLIQRNKAGQRHSGSLLENAINQLESMDKLSRLENPKQYGDTNDERQFSVALELTITWVNRILFLKLLEAQLKTYHKGNNEYAFLNNDRIKDYDNLNTLFFQVLAKKETQRNPDVKQLFEKVPYLNSSLFEMTDMEHTMFPISQLEDNKTLTLLSSTVIKDANGKKVTGEKNALQYFFSFLDAYDFSSEGAEEIQEDNKALINASVLGLIFEKINGYKDGSFFTPGFITMYMCREAIRKSVIQKFNEIKGWDCKNFLDLENKKHDIKESNAIINDLKICDPAVGSGHFLVSALNEIISIKSKLEILADKDGKLLHHYLILIENDELIVYDDRDRSLFQYNPLSSESQRVQETLFNEKKTIIENCLFGVDINPNSVKICRLRLWIELLKNAYYKTSSKNEELETLPNIDINIKSGNSLISRFSLDSDLKKALKDSKWDVTAYQSAVTTYHHAESKEQKREMEKIINTIKGNFRSEITKNDPLAKYLYKYKGDLFTHTQQTGLFERSKKEQAEWEKRLKSITADILKYEGKITDVENNKMYEYAFEWRFEFPEVLDGDGNYKGFDVIIGNPPYIQLQKMGQAGNDLQRMEYETYAKTGDIYSLFYELAIKLLKPQGYLSFITSNKWMRAAYGESLRKFFIEKSNPEILVDFGGIQVFDTATVDTNILIAEKAPYSGKTNACVLDKNFSINNTSDYIGQKLASTNFTSQSWVVLSGIEQQIKKKIEYGGTPLKEWDIKINFGIKTGYNEAFIINSSKRNEILEKCPKADEIIRPILRGRDIQKYRADSDLHIISTFPSLKIDISFYPAIQEHLLAFGFNRLKQTGDSGSRKKTNNQWFETQDSINYWEDFSKPKIVWGEISDKSKFSYDQDGYFIEATSFMMTGSKLKYLMALLNSKLLEWYFNQLGTATGVGTNRWKKYTIEQLPVKIPNSKEQKKLELLVEKILSTKISQDLEKEIDHIVNSIYNLSQEESDFIFKIKI